MTKNAGSEKAEDSPGEYELYNEMSPTLSKMSKKARKDPETREGLDRLTDQLRKSEFHAGRGGRKVTGSKTIFYMRSGGEARVFYRYSPTQKGAIEIVGESNKDTEQKVIDNLKKNYINTSNYYES